MYACLGKRLALSKVRRVTAEILTRYDIAHVPEHDRNAFLDARRDVFVLLSAPLPLVFSPVD